MPPKLKLHETSGKNVMKKPKQVNNEEPQPSTSMSPEAVQQFEVELAWCIQHLSAALNSGKLNRKQVDDHNKALRTLTGSAPVIKKRQVMRQSFGDYRTQMHTEEDKAKLKAMKMKVTSAKPNKKSVCLKKSLFASSTGNSFRFNFESPPEDDKEDVKEEPKESSENTECDDSKLLLNGITSDNKFRFKTTDNSFRFNFTVDDQMQS